MRSRWIVALLIVAGGVVTSRLSAQRPTACSFESTRFSTDSTAAGQVYFLGGNVLIKCPSRGITLRGDSAERYPDHDQVIGHSIYDEPRFHVTSDFLNYFPLEEKVVAVGHVNARLPSGSTLDGPIAEYRRVAPKIRTRAQMLARARPTINIVEKDSAGRPIPPTVVVANQVFMDGDSLIYASGEVTINRPDISATADSVFINDSTETMRLMRSPKLMGKKEKPFTLTGDLIDLFSRNHKLQRVLSRANAVAVSDSMTLKSDTIDLRIKNELLDHAYAWGTKSRARVVSPSQNMLADSLDVTMPEQKIRLVRALRDAFAQGRPDTARFQMEKGDSTDWLRGDTIVAHFDSVAAKDTSKTPPIKLLVADGHASSLYHLAPNDSAEKRPAVNYVNARAITINFDQQRVATVTAVDSVTGVYIEPKPDSTKHKADTSAAKAGKTPPTKTAPGTNPPAKTPPTKTPPVQPPVKPPASVDPSAQKRP